MERKHDPDQAEINNAARAAAGLRMLGLVPGVIIGMVVGVSLDNTLLGIAVGIGIGVGLVALIERIARAKLR